MISWCYMWAYTVEKLYEIKSGWGREFLLTYLAKATQEAFIKHMRFKLGCLLLKDYLPHTLVAGDKGIIYYTHCNRDCICVYYMYNIFKAYENY